MSSLPEYDPEQPPRMVCPACRTQPDGAVVPDCPVCHGTGTLTLGTAGLALHGPEVTRRAIRLILEATTSAAQTRQAMTDLVEVSLVAKPAHRTATPRTATPDPATPPERPQDRPEHPGKPETPARPRTGPETAITLWTTPKTEEQQA